MSKNRAKAEQQILELMKDIDKSGHNVEEWKKILKGMSDKDFEDYMKGILNGDMSLVVFAPHYGNSGITTDNNIKVAKKYNIKMFEKLIYEGNPNVPDHKTNIEFLVIDLPIRRQSQNIISKANNPPTNLSYTSTIDETVYQPTGDSKGAKISYPELNVLMGMSTDEAPLDDVIEEVFMVRGGDKGSLKAYEASMLRYGSVDLKAIKPYSTGVASTQYLKTIFLAKGMKLA